MKELTIMTRTPFLIHYSTFRPTIIHFFFAQISLRLCIPLMHKARLRVVPLIALACHFFREKSTKLVSHYDRFGVQMSLVNLSCNCDVKSGLKEEKPTHISHFR